jgi:hypothetical protein
MPDPVRIVWVTMMALADKDGIVWASVPGLAQQAKVGLQDCQNAIDLFLQPDSYSRSKESEGRRIEEVDGGWRLLSYGKYRDMMSRSDRRDYWREKKKEARERERILSVPEWKKDRAKKVKEATRAV